MPNARSAMPSIDAALDEFVAARREQLRPGALRDCEDVVELLRDSLNGYAYESLDANARRRWKRASDAGDETAFCRLFGPEQLLEHLGAFFGYFMVRKVMADQAFLHSTGSVVADLARWLGERGFIVVRQHRARADPGRLAAAGYFADMATLWERVNAEERRRLVAPLIERVYLDIESKRIGALKPTPEFRLLIEHALDITDDPKVILVPPEMAEDVNSWRWWRRGRPPLR